MLTWSKLMSFRLLLNKVYHTRCTHSFTGSNGVPSIEQIKKQFVQYGGGGGSIELNKNEETGIATITLNNPSKRNAVTGKMMVEFSDIVSELKVWSIGKAVILKSSDSDIFCSGGDLETVKQILNSSNGARMSKLMHDTTTNLLQLPLVSVAVIEGPAIGGGAELTTCCDYRLMGPTGSIQFVQGQMGVATGWGGGTRLVKMLGRSKALKLLLSGKKVKPHEAIEIGLVEELINGGVEQAIHWLIKLTGQIPPKIVHTLKNIVIKAENNSMENALLEERNLFADIWGGVDQINALNQKLKHK